MGDALATRVIEGGRRPWLLEARAPPWPEVALVVVLERLGAARAGLSWSSAEADLPVDLRVWRPEEETPPDLTFDSGDQPPPLAAEEQIARWLAHVPFVVPRTPVDAAAAGPRLAARIGDGRRLTVGFEAAPDEYRPTLAHAALTATDHPVEAARSAMLDCVAGAGGPAALLGLAERRMTTAATARAAARRALAVIPSSKDYRAGARLSSGDITAVRLMLRARGALWQATCRSDLGGADVG